MSRTVTEEGLQWVVIRFSHHREHPLIYIILHSFLVLSLNNTNRLEQRRTFRTKNRDYEALIQV